MINDNPVSHLLMSVFGLVALMGAAAHAQTAGSETETGTSAQVPEENSGLQEITVTAQRRKESLKDVPISVQAMTGEQLAQQVVVDTQDLAAISPTINFSHSTSSNASAFSLRGVSSFAAQIGIQPSAAMVVDGVALTRQAEFVAELADIEHIEVLNGPQGTLFGKNTTAGVINVVTKQPTNDFHAMVESTTTTDQEYGVRAMINMPLSDKVRLRVNGFYRDQSPLVENLSGPDVAGEKSYGWTAKLAVDPTDDLNLVLAATQTHSNSSYGQFTVVIPPNVYPQQGQQLQALTGLPFRRGLATVNDNSRARDITRSTSLAATLNWKITDKLNFVSISNYTQFAEDSDVDNDGSPAGANYGTGEDLPASTYPVKSISVNLYDRFPIRDYYYSQEARMNYESGPLKLVFGGYHQHLRENFKLRDPFNILTASGPTYVSSENRALLRDQTDSVFADATYSFTDHIKAFSGVRYTHEKLDIQYHLDDFAGPYSLYNPVTAVFAGAPVLTVDTTSGHTVNNVSGRAGFQYLPTSNLDFYVSYARGYKGPAADLGQSVQPKVDPIINPEKADAFEIGAKLRFHDRGALNIAVFHEEINGIQESITPSNGNSISIELLNAGRLITQGVEADGQWAVTPEFRLSSALSFDQATYSGFRYNCNPTQLSTGTCPNSGRPGFQDISGQQAIGSPKWKYSVSAAYDNRIPGSNLRYDAFVSWIWNSSIQYQLGDDPLTREPSHGSLNASVGLKGQDDHWEVQFYGKNLTNAFYYAYLLDVGFLGQQLGLYPRDFHRYGGVNLIYRY